MYVPVYITYVCFTALANMSMSARKNVTLACCILITVNNIMGDEKGRKHDSCSLNAIRIGKQLPQFQVLSIIYVTPLQKVFPLHVYLIFIISWQNSYCLWFSKMFSHFNIRNQVSHIRKGNMFYEVKGTKPKMLYAHSCLCNCLLILFMCE